MRPEKEGGVADLADDAVAMVTLGVFCSGSLLKPRTIRRVASSSTR